jgi:integrase
MKMPNSYGNVIKLSGKRRKPWAVRISYWEDVPGKPPKRKRKYLAYFTDQKHALSYLAEYNSGAIVKEHEKYADIPTFAELFYKWEAYRTSLKNNPSASCWKNYKIAFNLYAPIHDKKIISLRAKDLQDCISAQSAKSKATIGSMRAIVRGMWQYALVNEFTDKDITQHLVFESTYNGEPIHTRFTDEEIVALWNALGTINNVDIVLIYIYTGLRPVELLDIFSKDVHLEDRYMIGGAKTEAGRNRIIPIHEAIVPLIKFRLEQNREYLITNKYGNHYTRAVYHNSNWNTLMQKMNLNHAPHDCRYTFASLADQVSMNETCRKIIMGHALSNKSGTAFKTGGSSDVTQDIYTEKTLKQLIQEVNKLPTIFSNE